VHTRRGLPVACNRSHKVCKSEDENVRVVIATRVEGKYLRCSGREVGETRVMIVSSMVYVYLIKFELTATTRLVAIPSNERSSRGRSDGGTSLRFQLDRCRQQNSRGVRILSDVTQEQVPYPSAVFALSSSSFRIVQAVQLGRHHVQFQSFMVPFNCRCVTS